MNRTILALLAASALAAPALAGKTERVVVDQYRAKIEAARAEPGVGRFGGAELDKATATLPELAKRLDKKDSGQVQASITQIDTLIATARERAKLAAAKEDAVDAAGARAAERDATAQAQADAERARAQADRARADADRLRAQMAEYRLRQTQLGATLVLQDVVFETGRAALKPGAEARLAPLASYLKANPAVQVRVDGHTDSVGADVANMQLSQARAAAVRAALSTMGIDAGRVQAIGHGEAQPVAANTNAAGRQQNRRVEITLVGQQAGQFAALQ